MNEMQRRVDACEATVAKFRGRPFQFGTCDCAKIATAHLRHMGRKVTGLAKAGTYNSALGARRALKRVGYGSLADALTGLGLLPIASAAALPGDIVIGDGGDSWEAMGVFVGNGMLFAFHDDALEAGPMMVRVNRLADVKAWRA